MIGLGTTASFSPPGHRTYPFCFRVLLPLLHVSVAAYPPIHSKQAGNHLRQRTKEFRNQMWGLLALLQHTVLPNP